jgi:hypothetical protein
LWLQDEQALRPKICEDNLPITSIGICDDFAFTLGGLSFTIKVYVCEKAAFQLLFGNHFLWPAGAALFPRMGKNYDYTPGITYHFSYLQSHSSSPSSAPLGNQPPREPSPEATRIVDSASGEELLENPPSEFHYCDTTLFPSAHCKSRSNSHRRC